MVMYFKEFDRCTKELDAQHKVVPNMGEILAGMKYPEAEIKAKLQEETQRRNESYRGMQEYLKGMGVLGVREERSYEVGNLPCYTIQFIRTPLGKTPLGKTPLASQYDFDTARLVEFAANNPQYVIRRDDPIGSSIVRLKINIKTGRAVEENIGDYETEKDIGNKWKELKNENKDPNVSYATAKTGQNISGQHRERGLFGRMKTVQTSEPKYQIVRTTQETVPIYVSSNGIVSVPKAAVENGNVGTAVDAIFEALFPEIDIKSFPPSYKEGAK